VVHVLHKIWRGITLQICDVTKCSLLLLAVSTRLSVTLVYD